jgi:TetR/AcrR family acrAB operon transcriptional repressor
MARRTREEALATREELLNAAEMVFRKRGVGHTSLAEVADAAGVTRGALYWHFKDKADLFQAMVARAELPHELSLQNMETAAAVDPLGAVRTAAIEALSQFAIDERARNVYEVVFLRCEYTDELASVRKGRHESRLDCYSRMASALRAAVACGQLPAHTAVRLAVRGLYAYVGGLMRDFLDAPGEFDIARDAPALVDFYIDGLKHAPERRPAPRAAKRRLAQVRAARRSAS